jgi:hypothetical protein
MGSSELMEQLDSNEKPRTSSWDKRDPARQAFGHDERKVRAAHPEDVQVQQTRVKSHIAARAVRSKRVTNKIRKSLRKGQVNTF